MNIRIRIISNTIKRLCEFEYLIIAVWFFIIIFCLCGCNSVSNSTASGESINSGAEEGETPVSFQNESNESALNGPTIENYSIPKLFFSRETSSSISLTWADKCDEHVAFYLLVRSETTGKNTSWETIAQIPSDGLVTGEEYTFVDELSCSKPQQYYYRIDIVPSNYNLISIESGKPILASNIMVCIDPGHFSGSSSLNGTNLYNYEEGLFTLRLGLKLQEILREQYGIDSRMTRNTDIITIGGYTNNELDQQHLSLRGEYAIGCDLFISLHTNANLNNANGYPTCDQPIELTKTLVFVNQLATESEIALQQANAIGQNVSQVNYDIGLATSNRFIDADANTMLLWSDAYNDSLDTPGTICYRQKDNGEDYYGVLRGANSVGVPGIIVEHGYHTVPKLRELAMKTDLDLLWAKADAAGIALGYDFSSGPD